MRQSRKVSEADREGLQKWAAHPASDAGDLALRGTTLEVPIDRGAVIGLQDIHSSAFRRGRPEKMSCQQVLVAPALPPVPDQLRWGSLRWPSGLSVEDWTGESQLGRVAPGCLLGGLRYMKSNENCKPEQIEARKKLRSTKYIGRTAKMFVGDFLEIPATNITRLLVDSKLRQIYRPR